MRQAECATAPMAAVAVHVGVADGHPARSCNNRAPLLSSPVPDQSAPMHIHLPGTCYDGPVQRDDANAHGQRVQPKHVGQSCSICTTTQRTEHRQRPHG